MPVSCLGFGYYCKVKRPISKFDKNSILDFSNLDSIEWNNLIKFLRIENLKFKNLVLEYSDNNFMCLRIRNGSTYLGLYDTTNLVVVKSKGRPIQCNTKKTDSITRSSSEAYGLGNLIVPFLDLEDYLYSNRNLFLDGTSVNVNKLRNNRLVLRGNIFKSYDDLVNEIVNLLTESCMLEYNDVEDFIKSNLLNLFLVNITLEIYHFYEAGYKELELEDRFVPDDFILYEIPKILSIILLDDSNYENCIADEVKMRTYHEHLMRVMNHRIKYNIQRIHYLLKIFILVVMIMICILPIIYRLI